MGKQCEYSKSDGTRCEAFAVKGSIHCFTHDDASKEAKKKAVKKGGSHKIEYIPEPIQITSILDVIDALIYVANEVLAKRMTTERANCAVRALSTLAGILKP